MQVDGDIQGMRTKLPYGEGLCRFQARFRFTRHITDMRKVGSSACELALHCTLHQWRPQASQKDSELNKLYALRSTKFAENRLDETSIAFEYGGHEWR